MKALVYTAPKKFQVKDIGYPRLRENQVIIKVKACGVCKTDLHIHNGLQHCEYPLIGPRSEVILQEGMVFSIDIGLFNFPFGGVRVEDGVLVTKKGVKVLAKMD